MRQNQALLERIDRLEVPPLDARRLVLAGLRWPSRLPAAEWVEANVVMSTRLTAEPGPVDLRHRTPHIVEPLNAMCDGLTRRVVLKKCTQSSGTTAVQLALTYFIANDPGPAMFTFPTEQLARKVSDQRMRPLVEDTPALRDFMPARGYDIKNLMYSLRNMTVHFAWANSPATLASFPIRFVFHDEVNKFPAFSGREADPIKLADERTITYWNKLQCIVSTPTRPDGYVSREYAESDRREYQVPCLKCGTYQGLNFRERVKWPKEVHDHPHVIERDQLAWHECKECGDRMYERDRMRAVRRGVWCPEGATVDQHGRVLGAPEQSAFRGYQWNRMVTPWGSFGLMAKEWLLSHGKPEKLMNFVNSWLAEDWVEEIQQLRIDTRGEVPGSEAVYGRVSDGSGFLTAGADVQLDYIRVTVRSWQGYTASEGGEHTGLVEEWHVGIATPERRARAEKGLENWEFTGPGETEFDAVERVFLTGEWSSAGGQSYQIRLLCIDSRYRRQEVYAFARRHPQRVYAVEGSERPITTPYQPNYADREIVRGRIIVPKKNPLTRWSLDTVYYKDLIARLCSEGKWHLPAAGVTGSYHRQFEAEHKVVERNTMGTPVELWRKKPGSDANHALDCEVYAVAGADILGYWRNGVVRPPQQGPRENPRPAMRMPDGRPFLVTER